MLGFKSFWSARIVIAGIETMKMIRKGQMNCPEGINRIRSTAVLQPRRLISKSPAHLIQVEAVIATEPHTDPLGGKGIETVDFHRWPVCNYGGAEQRLCVGLQFFRTNSPHRQAMDVAEYCHKMQNAPGSPRRRMRLRQLTWLASDMPDNRFSRSGRFQRRAWQLHKPGR